jgi:hypothetical protein
MFIYHKHKTNSVKLMTLHSKKLTFLAFHYILTIFKKKSFKSIHLSIIAYKERYKGTLLSSRYEYHCCLGQNLSFIIFVITVFHLSCSIKIGDGGGREGERERE